LIIFDEKDYAERLLVEGYIRKEKISKLKDRIKDKSK
jgi:hypothetical protein